MGRLIKEEERDAAEEAAIVRLREMIGQEHGDLHPNAKLGSMSDHEMRKLVANVVSQWIVERSRLLTEERFDREEFFLATGEVPEPAELGVCATCLPALGNFVERLRLGDTPIGAWPRDMVLLFVWTCAELVGDARTHRAERPGTVELPEITRMLAV